MLGSPRRGLIIGSSAIEVNVSGEMVCNFVSDLGAYRLLWKPNIKYCRGSSCSSASLLSNVASARIMTISFGCITPNTQKSSQTFEVSLPWYSRWIENVLGAGSPGGYIVGYKLILLCSIDQRR